MTDLPLTLPLDRPAAADLATAGGKGASLVRLVAAGLPVPDGFIVSTAAYRQFVHANDLEAVIASAAPEVATAEPERLDTASQAIGGAFSQAATPAEVETAVVAAYASLPGDAPAVAVRSSATAEDLPDLSFAGQQETFLNVRGAEAVVDAVKRCWASLWTSRAIGYRAQHDVETEGVGMAVVVQLLVPAESAGVLFTAHPITGRRDQVVINASWGLGEAIVAGQVTPDTLILDKGDRRVVSREINDKTVMTVRSDDGSEEQPVPNERRRRPALDDGAATELLALADRIEALYGQPMDIEWARAEGRIAILQARPITALPEPSAAPPSSWDVPEGHIYFRASAIELLPNPLSPLYETLGLPAVQHAMDRLFMGLIGLPAPMEKYEAVNGYAYQGMALRIRPMLGMLLRMPLAILVFFRGGPTQWRAEQRERYASEVAPWSDGPLEERRAAELLEGARAIAEAGGDYLGLAMRRTMPVAMMSELAFVGFYDRLVKRRDDPSATTFLLGLDSEPILAEKSLFDLARWSQAQPGLAAWLAETPTASIIDHVNDVGSPGPVSDADWQAWRERFQGHLDRYGAMLYDMDFVRSVPADEPAPLIDTLRFYLAGAVGDPGARQRKLTAAREEATGRIHGRLTWGPRRKIFDLLLAWSLSALPMREAVQADIGLGWPALRRLLRELGRRAAHVGVLTEPDDIFWLTAEEADGVAAALDAGGRGLTPRDESVRQRKAVWRGRAQVTPPPALPVGKKFFGFNLARLMPAAAEGAQGDVIKGLGARAGTVTAPARVLHGPEDFGKMQPGEVLVAAITTPAWTTLFALASAIVTDVGGVLSHSSIVAREYDIPAVLGTGVATTRIQDGQMLRVDGSAGTVEVVDD